MLAALERIEDPLVLQKVNNAVALLRRAIVLYQ